MDVLIYKKLLESSVHRENSSDKGPSSPQVKRNDLEPDICHQSSTSSVQMDDMVHVNVITYKCDCCEKLYASFLDLQLHQKVHSNPEVSISESRVFDIVRDLNQYESVYCIKKFFSCDLCLTTFSNNEQLKQHSLAHNNLELYKCAICFKNFRGLENFKEHQMMHPSTKDFKCHLCWRTHSSLSDLLRHQRRHHIGEKGSFLCQFCLKACLSNSDLIKHMRSHGIGEKTWKCDTCSNSFYDNQSLEIHQRTHTGDKPFECELCHKKFSQIANRNRHRRVHTNEKPFECGVCGERFTTKHSSDYHMGLHSDIKPFECEICFKAFPHNEALKKHKRKHVIKIQSQWRESWL